MKRTMTTVGVVALLTIGLLAQSGIGQSPQSPDGPPDEGPRSERFKTQLLIAINEAGLSVEQLEMLQDLAEATIEARDVLQAAHEELQAFLVEWSGPADEFEAALEEARQDVDAAREALKTQMETNFETLAESLTAAQFQALVQIGPDRGDGERGPRGQREGRFGPQRGDGPRAGAQRALPLFAHPDLLLDVVTAKIEALQGS